MGLSRTMWDRICPNFCVGTAHLVGQKNRGKALQLGYPGEHWVFICGTPKGRTTESNWPSSVLTSTSWKDWETTIQTELECLCCNSINPGFRGILESLSYVNHLTVNYLCLVCARNFQIVWRTISVFMKKFLFRNRTRLLPQFRSQYRQIRCFTT